MRLHLQLLLLSFLSATRFVSGLAITPLVKNKSTNIKSSVYSIVRDSSDEGSYSIPTRTHSWRSASTSWTAAAETLASPTHKHLTTSSPAIPKRTFVAVSILLAALPSSEAASLTAEWFALTSHFSTRSTSATTSSATTSSTTSSLTTSFTTTTTSSSTTSSQSQSTPMTVASVTPSTSTTPTSSPSKGLSSGAVAGIVIGSVLGALLLLAGAILLLRRLHLHQHQQPGDEPASSSPGFGFGFLRRRRGRNSIFPESAWLYDPSPSPPRSSSHETAQQPLHPRNNDDVQQESVQPTLHPGPEHRTPEVTMVSPPSAVSEPYIMSSPEHPHFMTTPSGDTWISPFPDEGARHRDFSIPSWYGYSRPI